MDYWLTLITAVVIVLSRLSLSFFALNEIKPSIISLFVVNFALSIAFFNIYSPLILYFIFEISVVPIFIIIIGWGYQPERIKASYAMIFYTIISSVPIVIMLLTLNLFSPLVLRNLEANSRVRHSTFIISLCLTLGFLVKLPIYSIHLWLPLAHVEAPVFGSIILAGILLKLGGLGIVRFITLFTRIQFKSLCISLRIVGAVIVGLTCLKLTDIKSVIAFSSVSHIGIVIIIISIRLKLTIWAIFIIMLTHAFRSSIIFYCSYIIYKVTGTRNIILNKGALSALPNFRICWLVAVIARIGTPPFVNLISEIYSIYLSLLLLGKWVVILVIIFITGRAFHLVLYSSTQQEIFRWDNSRKLESRVSASSLVNSHSHSICLVFSIFILIELRI